MALYCIISDTKRDIGRKWWFFHTPLHWAPPLGGSRQSIAIPFGKEKLEWCGYLTDRRTDIFRRHSPRYAYASRGKIVGLLFVFLLNPYTTIETERILNFLSSCENGIFQWCTITSSLRSVVQVLMGLFTIFSHPECQDDSCQKLWKLPKFVKVTATILSVLFFRTRCTMSSTCARINTRDRHMAIVC